MNALIKFKQPAPPVVWQETDLDTLHAPHTPAMLNSRPNAGLVLALGMLWIVLFWSIIAIGVYAASRPDLTPIRPDPIDHLWNAPCDTDTHCDQYDQAHDIRGA